MAAITAALAVLAVAVAGTDRSGAAFVGELVEDDDFGRMSARRRGRDRQVA